MSAISIQNISKTYPPPFPRVRKFFGMSVKESVVAIKGVSLEIEKG